MGETRRIVTIVFADVSGSTRLGEELDAEALRRVMERYFEEMRSILEFHGGTVEKFIGDAVMAAFGIPVVHEDDALRAVRAAVEMRARLIEVNDELQRERGVILAVRTGVNTGEVVAGDSGGGDFYASGDAVNVAARLEQAAQPGEILLGETTYRLVRDAVSVEALEPLVMRGKTTSVSVYRLLEVIGGAPALARRLDTPFVGRDEELAHLLACFDRSLAERTPVLVTVLGPAGIGKTRLATELIAQVSNSATVLEGRCLSYGEGITFLPLEEILRNLAELPPGVKDPEEARSTEDAFLAYRKLFEALARERPLVLALEDIHWAEPTLLDLLEHIAEWTRDVPILIVCLARPELLEERSAWPGDRLELEPLSGNASEMLAAALAPGLDPSSRMRADDAAEGNPLFLEQLLALAAEDDDELTLPHTIQALLAARVDRLETNERGILERAAVIGKEFWRGALIHLSPPETEVSALLQRLMRKRLIRAERSTLLGEDAFRFAHILIRDAAYAGIPKEMRADLHERFAHWLESSSPHEEIVGYHLEQAYRYRAELGPIDASGERLARRAAEVLSAAGEQAYARGDHAGAANLLTRVADLLPRGDPLRLSSLPRLGESLFWLGRYSEARSLLAEAIEDARRLGDRGIEWKALLIATRIETHAASPGALTTTKEFERRAREALAVFEELGDVAGQANAGLHVGQALFWQFRNEAALRAFADARARAKIAGDEGLADMCAGFMTGALCEGPTPVEEAIERVKELLATATSRVIFLERVFLGSLATLYARRERFDEARRYLQRTRAHAEEFGAPVDIAMIAAFEVAAVERMAGNLKSAETELRNGYEILVRLGESGGRSTAAVNLARVLAAENRPEEAEDFLRISEETAASDDLATQVPLRLIRARLQAERGEPGEAESLVREALALLEGTDDLEARSDALLTLARVLGGTKKTPEAVTAVEEAMRLCKRKGNVVLGREAQQLLDELATAPSVRTSS
jgi:class 3 adenylate cyclase/tetratricopeptide (TPR) repeat protein